MVSPATTSVSAATTPATIATTSATTSVSSVASQAPYPVGNATVPAPSGSGTGLPTTTAGPSSTSPAAYNPANGANALAIGSKFIAGIAAVGALAML